MKTLIKGILTTLVVFGLCIQAQAQTTHEITEDADEATIGDLDIIKGALATATAGDPVSKSLRRVVMAATGELQLLLRNRIDDFGILTLDDGSLVGLLDGDGVRLCPQARGVCLFFRCTFGRKGTTCRPAGLIIRRRDGTIPRCFPIPPKTVPTLPSDPESECDDVVPPR